MGILTLSAVPVLALVVTVGAMALDQDDRASPLANNEVEAAPIDAIADAAHPLPMLIRTPGTYAYAFGRRTVDIQQRADGSGLSLTFTCTSPGMTTRTGPDITLDPASPWLVYIESEDRAWWFDGNAHLQLEQHTIAGTSSEGWGAVKTELAKHAPRRLVAALPDAMAREIIRASAPYLPSADDVDRTLRWLHTSR